MHHRAPYAAKFSVPFGVALGLLRGHADLGDYSEESIADPELLKLAAKVNYEVDENNPYPAAFTGHVRLQFKDGSEQEVRQGFMRGGRDAPLSQAEIQEKFYANCRLWRSILIRIKYWRSARLLLQCRQGIA